VFAGVQTARAALHTSLATLHRRWAALHWGIAGQQTSVVDQQTSLVDRYHFSFPHIYRLVGRMSRFYGRLFRWEARHTAVYRRRFTLVPSFTPLEEWCRAISPVHTLSMPPDGLAQTAQHSRLLHRELTGQILGAFYSAYQELGGGFVEAVYERALAKELIQLGLYEKWGQSLQIPLHL